MPGYNLCLELIKMDLHELKMSQAPRHCQQRHLYTAATPWASSAQPIHLATPPSRVRADTVSGFVALFCMANSRTPIRASMAE